MHGAIAEQFAVAEDLPCADPKFLAPLKRSREFRSLRPRLAGRPPHPVFDSWLDDGFHFFTFVLMPTNGGDSSAPRGGLAVFAMHPDKRDPVSAITVVPTEDGREASITDLKESAGSYLAPLPGQDDSES